MKSNNTASIWGSPITGHIALASTRVALLVVLGLAGTAAPAQDSSSSFVPADTSSPRGTLKSFIDSCNEFYRLTRTDRHFDRRSPLHRPVARRILDCLDISELPDFAREDIAAEAAVCLKEILDRVELPPFEEIPDGEAIKAAGGPEELPRWHIPGTRLTIARVEEGPQKHEYLFTPGTIDRAADYFEEIEHLEYRTTGPEVTRDLHQWFTTAPGHPIIAEVVDRSPAWTRERVGSLAVWQWMGLSIAVLMMISAMALFYQMQRSLAARWQETSVCCYGLTILFSVGAVLVPFVFLHVVERALTIRGVPLYVISFSTNFLALLAAIVVVLGASDRIAAMIIASPQVNPRGLNAQLIRTGCKIGSIVVAVILFLEGGHYLGIPVTTLLASAGIGGLAVALAAQDTLKTLFGTIMVLVDKPFRVGERIIFSNYDGVVEDIGLRSTKLRLLSGHQAHIPNDELARSDIENVGRRPHIRRKATIEMPSDTPAAKVRRALEIVRAAVDNHEGMDAGFPPRVFLRDLNASSVGIVMYYWYHPADYWEFLAFSERVNLQIMEWLEAEQISFAAPALTVHTAEHRRPGLNAGVGADDWQRELLNRLS